MAAAERAGILRWPGQISSSSDKDSFSNAPRSYKQVVVKSSTKDELYAASTGEVNWLQLCLQKTECPTESDINGFSALHTAALFGRLDCLKMLVEKYRVDVNSPSLTGWRPIHLVMNKESGAQAMECLKYLISKKADVNMQNQNGVSPLHKAASEGRTDCVKVLIDAGADVHAKDREGQEPIDLCRMWGHRECSKYLSSTMWKIDKDNFARETRKLNKIKIMCQVKQEELSRTKQMELNCFNNLVFSEWLQKKHLSPPSARLLSFPGERAPSTRLPKRHRRPGRPSAVLSSLGEISFLEDFEKDRRHRPWNVSTNPASAPATRIFRPNTVRMGVSPEPSEDLDFGSFLSLVKNRSRRPEIHLDPFGTVSPMPALSYESIQRSLYPQTWSSRLKVPQGLKSLNICDVQSKRPPSPEHRWTDQMALSLRQTLDPSFVAALKTHLATYSDAEVPSPKPDSGHGSSKESSSPSLGSSRLD